MRIGSREFGEEGACGVVFALAAGPRRHRSFTDGETSVTFAEGWQHAEVAVARDIRSIDELQARCHDALQQAIDVRFVRDGGPPITVDTTCPAVQWRHEGGRTEVTLVERVSPGVLTETSWKQIREEEVIAQSEDLPDPARHESFRFRRVAATAQDVFDAYRNTYLAFEALLSSEVSRTAGEREVAWLERALATIQTNHDVDISVFEIGGATPDLWIQGQYEAFRCALFHAKSNAGGRWLPADSESTARVSAALMSLEPFVRHLALRLQNVDTGIGVMTYAGMLHTARAITSEGFDFGRTPDAVNVDRADVDLSPNGLTCTWIPGQWSGEPSGRPDTFRFEGSGAVDRDGTTEPVSRVGMRVGGRVLMTVSRLDDLELSGATDYRHVIDWSIWNRGFIRDPYA